MAKDPKRANNMKSIGKSNTWSKGRRLKGRPGFAITSNGHKILYIPDHPFSSKKGYIMEHRVIVEENIGRYLKPEEKVHHLNGIKLDNRIENLKLCSSQSEHISNHKDISSGKFISVHH